MARNKTGTPKQTAVKKVSSQVTRRAKKPIKKEPETITMIPSPSSLFNCALSDEAGGGFSLGRMVNLIGDSAAGKTILAKSIFAEASTLPFFDDYDFIFDDVENADDFDDEYLFGKKVAEKVKAPHYKDGEPTPSDTIEDFHFNIRDALDKGKPFIYVLDSFDALDSIQDQKKIDEMRTARAKGNIVKGSYGMSKPKKASDLLRNICGRLRKTNSVLIIISQTRDNIDPMSFEKKTRSGGRALKFYAHHEIWLAVIRPIKSKDRTIGHNVRAKVKKNKITGKVREVDFPIYYDYGIDDIRSSLEWITDEEFWEKTKNTIHATDLKKSGTYDTLIKHVESQSLEKRLRNLVGKFWNTVEDELKLNRKRRYK